MVKCKTIDYMSLAFMQHHKTKLSRNTVISQNIFLHHNNHPKKTNFSLIWSLPTNSVLRIHKCSFSLEEKFLNLIKNLLRLKTIHVVIDVMMKLLKIRSYACSTLYFYYSVQVIRCYDYLC